MSLDSTISRLTRFGTVTVTADFIVIEGFEGSNTSCRDVAVQAALWAIGELQREVLKKIEEPGGGNMGIG